MSSTPTDTEIRGLSRRARWAAGEPIASRLMAKALAPPEIISLAAVLNRGLFDLHMEMLRAAYRKKIDPILDAADPFLRPIGGVEWGRPSGGLYVWLRLPEWIDTGLSGPLFDRAVEEGVLYVPGEYCYPPEGRPAPKHMLRLSFGVPSCDDLRRGVESLARAIRQVALTKRGKSPFCQGRQLV